MEVPSSLMCCQNLEELHFFLKEMNPKTGHLGGRYFVRNRSLYTLNQIVFCFKECMKKADVKNTPLILDSVDYIRKLDQDPIFKKKNILFTQIRQFFGNHLFKALHPHFDRNKILNKIEKNAIHYSPLNHHDVIKCENTQKGAPEEMPLIEIFKISAESGNAEALYELAISYYEGKVVQKDLNQAFRYFQLSADQKYAAAQCRLGYLYLHGEGTLKDPKKAFEYFRAAAQQVFVEAYFYLAVCYESGEGVVPNFQKAFNYYQLAENHGYIQARYHLALCYYEGLGTPQNFNKAFVHFQSIAELGHLDALVNVARLYEKGLGVKKDILKAIHYYQQAAEQEHVQAQYRLAKCYEMENDLEKAFHYFARAAAQGNAKSALHIQSKNGIQKT